MGLRKIDDEIDFKKAMKKKGAELKIKEMKAKASVENLTRDKLNEMAKRHGVLLALNPKLKEDVEYLQERYNIPSNKIIKEQITEESVLSKRFGRIDHEKLGMLAYQRILLRKDEIGADVLPLSEVFDLVHTGKLKDEVEIDDVAKAMEVLEKQKVIENIKETKSGAIMVQFFPIEYTQDEKKVINLVKEIGEGFVSLEDVIEKLEWTQNRALKALNSLEDTGLAKYNEHIVKGKRWFFPSL
jgi:hypothetical protein